MRKLGIDYGDSRIGLALSDPMGIIASSLETLHSRGQEADIKYITALAKEREVDTLVVGLPLNMDGTNGPRALKTKTFAERLQEASGLKIEFIDERLTTVASEKLLIEAGTRREKRKEVIDKVAASIILQTFLDRRK